MTDHGPGYDDLVGGDDLDPVADGRLRRVHDLLVATGPPPELSPRVVAAGEAPPGRPRVPPVRRRHTLLVAAAVAGLVLFGAGYLVGGRDESAAFTVAMRGAHGEWAELAVYDKDAAGNWPMRLRLSAVTLRAGVLYELWLTKAGRLEEQCGSFLATEGLTTVPLNAPYRLRRFDGWVVVPHGSRKAILWTPKSEA